MRRVITVNLGGNAFQLDEDAYERLRAYIALTESRLVSNPDRAEIIGDLERAVAEHITANRAEATSLVIADAQMQQALATVGTVEHNEGIAAPERLAASAAPAQAHPRDDWDRPAESDYTRLPVFLLCLLFGWLGVHRFFVGKVGTGVLMLVTIGGLGIWIMIDLILIILGDFKDRDGRKILRWS
jgi:hypothetical protein